MINNKSADKVYQQSWGCLRSEIPGYSFCPTDLCVYLNIERLSSTSYYNLSGIQLVEISLVGA